MCLVSLVIPTYNRADRVLMAIKSVFHQSFKDFELIIIDDASSDNTNEVVTNLHDPRIVYIRHERNKGAPVARNKGIKNAKGKYIALLDDDDEWLPEKLESQVELFERSPENVGLVYTWAKVVDEKGSLLREWRSNTRGSVLKEILKECFVPSPSVMVKRECFEKVGLFDERFPSCQDWEMWTRIATEYEFDVVEEFLVRYYKYQGPSVGGSKQAIYGYYMYFNKYQNLYIDMGMEKELSHYLGWLGYEIATKGDKGKARECFRSSFRYNKFNWKTFLRVIDYVIFNCKIIQRYLKKKPK
jgi:glycosyltransferase involved in cell wall biosynthesis